MMMHNRIFNGISLLWAFVACICFATGIAGRNIQTGEPLQFTVADLFVFPIVGFTIAITFLGLERLIASDKPWRREWWLCWPTDVRQGVLLLVVGSAATSVGSLVRAAIGSLDAVQVGMGAGVTGLSMWAALALWKHWFHPNYIED